MELMSHIRYLLVAKIIFAGLELQHYQLINIDPADTPTSCIVL